MKTVYGLALADVHTNVDCLSLVAVSCSKEILEKWEVSQRAPEEYTTEPHMDAFGQSHPYQLAYKDGPLKWYNPPTPGLSSFGGIVHIPVPDGVTEDDLRMKCVEKGCLFISEKDLEKASV
jgi:hypothetical protein